MYLLKNRVWFPNSEQYSILKCPFPRIQITQMDNKI
jgi:hypothetical protein